MKVICYGDSNTYGFDPRSFLGSRYTAENRWTDILAAKTGWKICNQGINGEEIPREKRLFSDDTDLLIIMLGTNDLLQGKKYYEIAKRMGRFLEMISLQNVLLVAPPPLQLGEWVSDHSYIEESMKLSEVYKGLADKHKLLFADAGEWNVDLVFDGVHFSERGHQAFAEGLYDYLSHIDMGGA